MGDVDIFKCQNGGKKIVFGSASSVSDDDETTALWKKDSNLHQGFLQRPEMVLTHFSRLAANHFFQVGNNANAQVLFEWF